MASNIDIIAGFYLGIDMKANVGVSGGTTTTPGGASVTVGGLYTSVSSPYGCESSVEGGNVDGKFDLGDPMRFRAEFFDLSDDKTSADPTNVRFMLLTPITEQTIPVSYPGNLIRDAVGSYHYDTIATEAGEWAYRFEGSGAVVAAEDGISVVKSSPFYTTGRIS